MPSEISAASHVNNDGEKEMSMQASKVMEQVSMQALKMKAVSNGFRRLVLGLLYTDGPMYQLDILKHVEIKSNLLAYHLEILVSANMVEQRYTEREGQKFSRYSIKEEGRKFLEQIGAITRLDAIKKSDDEASLAMKRKMRRHARALKNPSRQPPNKPRNRICKKCGRRSVAPETTRRGGEWKEKGRQICTNCSLLDMGSISAISLRKRRLKKSVRESMEVFPLRILDRSLEVNVGIFYTPEDLKKELNSYRAEHPKSDIRIIDKKYHDYTADTLDVPDFDAKANR